MFTGIIEETGEIGRLVSGGDGARIEIGAQRVLEGAQIGDSIAVNGVCLTVVAMGRNFFAADVSSETLKRTSLQGARPGLRVNLERPLTPSSRLGGHIVQGHVDGVGRFIEARPAGEGWTVRIGFPEYLGRYIVEKGSIAVDGISLTVAALGEDYFEIAIIPHTWRETNLGALERGDQVNLEVDIIAKYVERLLAPREIDGNRE
ncbi:MAG: riboflavin synthase [Acidobacteria bacterium]|nr:riboflavin synthase [Acidobacteriota bacterium]MCW5970545.1 riboflavin synthase [Blastocatellales bacterium]